MATNSFYDTLKSLQEKGFFKRLIINRGIEREALRVSFDGEISQKIHPKELGSSLTNPYITTDFSEALIELVTPTFDTPEKLYDFLFNLHLFVNKHLHDEMLWNFSMPCSFKDEQEIKLAEYGSSNSGKLKNIYRRGLQSRYGSIMQCVAGIHYNFSLSKDSWLAFINKKSVSQNEININYLNLIRNLKRYYWFIAYYFGASPLCDESFVLKRDHDLVTVGKDDVGLPHATSLRMSEIGYQSPIQRDLNITYNDLNGFIDSLIEGISRPVDKFSRLGLLDRDGYPLQISDGILQIENELYDFIRPKRKGGPGTRPATLLKKAGIEYVELRAIDINPYEYCGINIDQIKVIDLVLLYCLISPSKPINNKELKQIESTNDAVINHGRDSSCRIYVNNQELNLQEAASSMIEDLSVLAKHMDKHSTGYESSLENIIKQKQTLSEKILSDLNKSDLSFSDFATLSSKEHFEKHNGFADNKKYNFKEAADASLSDQVKIEGKDKIDIIQYVKLYNSKIKDIK